MTMHMDNGHSDMANLIAELAKARAENEQLKARAAAMAKAKLRLKVSEKGAVTLLGIASQYGVTQYAQNWLKILEFGPEIKAFIEENKSELSWKD